MANGLNPAFQKKIKSLVYQFLPKEFPEETINAMITRIMELMEHREEEWYSLLEEKEKQLKTITESMTDIVWSSDLSFHLNFVSPSVEKILGFTVEEYLNLPREKIFPPESIQKCLTILKEELEKEQDLTADPERTRIIELPLYRKDGMLVDVSMNVKFIRDEHGVPIGISGISREITYEKKIRDALHYLITELAFLKGKEFFNAISEYLANSLKLDYVYVGEYVPELYGVKVIGGYMKADRVKEVTYILHGTPCEQVMGKTTCIFPSDVQRLFPQDTLLKEMNVEGYIGSPIFSKNREMLGILVGLKSSPIQNNDLILDLFNIFVNNIAAEMQRTKAEKQLKESENKLRSIYDNVNDAIFLHDETGKILDVNETACRNLGYSRDELLQMYLEDIVAPDLVDLSKHRIRQISKNKKMIFESRYIRKDGSIFPVEVNSSIIYEKGKRIFLGVARDVSERKEVERALEESEIRFTQLANATDMGIFIYQDDRFVYTNPAAEKMTGYTSRELLEMKFWEIIHPDDQEIVIQRGKARQRGEKVEPNYEIRIIDRNGNVHWLYLNATNVFFKGKPAGLATALDITELKRAEQERQKLQEQLLQAQKMESIGRLAGGVAHDFNNMLAVILGRADILLQKKELEDNIIRQIKEIRQAALRAEALTGQLLAFARKQTISPKILDLNQIVSSTLSMLRRLIGEYIKLEWKPDKNLPPIKMDPSQIDQILANLCINARDAIGNRNDGKIIIESGVKEFDAAYCKSHPEAIPGTFVMLSVSDNGSGMNKETLQKIFEPFFTTKKAGVGTGLGLAMVYGIMKQNNGFIRVYSEPGMGATFKLFFPVYSGKSKKIAKKRMIANQIPKGQGTILLVEDETSILSMTKEMLEEIGYNVIISNSGKEAVELSEKWKKKIDLLITDVIMPDMNGKQLAEKMKEKFPDMKILFMSGYTADVIAQHGILDKGVHYIQKPFSMKALTEKIYEILMI